MLKKVLGLLIFLIPFLSFSQTGGFINLNDFSAPTYPYQFSRFWLRGSIPAGSNPVMEFYGLSASKFYTDTVFIPKLALRDDVSPYRLVWIDALGMLRAITPPYLKISDTTGKWLPVGTTIPGAQVNSDWNSVTGVSQILNKPTLAAVATTGAYSDLTGQPTIPAAQVNSDWNSVSGVSQILNKPTIKRQLTFLGTTDGSGNYTVTYGTAFGATPDVQPQLQSSTALQLVRITASSTTGFTVQATTRTVISLLGVDLLSGTSTALASASVSVLVTER